MRTLLILGTEEMRRDYVKAARREQCKVIVGSLDREVSREAAGDLRLFIGASDQEMVLDAASRYAVSGILGLGNEEALSAAYAAQRLELAGMPYAPAMLFHNMLNLRTFQKRHHFRVPGYHDISLQVPGEELHWPLYVDAADDMSLEYIERVENRCELRDARQRAIRRSNGGMVIAHEFPEPEEADTRIWLVTDLVIRGGQLQPPVWNACMMCGSGEDRQITGYTYPARIADSGRVILDSECARLSWLLQLQDAQLGIVVCMDQGRIPYIVSVGMFHHCMRMQGFLSALYRHDLIRDVIQIALGDHADDARYALPERGTYMACYIVRVHRCGILRRVHVHTSIDPYIESWRERVRQGSCIYGHPGCGQEIGDLFLRFPDAAVMDEILGQMEDLVEVEMDDLP